MEAEVAAQLAAPAAEEPAAAAPAAPAPEQQQDQQQIEHEQQEQQQDQQQGSQEQVEPEQDAVVQPQQYVSLHEAAEVEIRVSNITRQGLDLLENLLRNWAVWQQQAYAQGYPAESQLLSGKLALDVPRLFRDGAVGWQDTIAPVPGIGQRQQQAVQAAIYEEIQAAPMYDRAISELLAAPAVAGRGINMLPGGAEATRRRQMAEARLDEAEGAAAVAAKRRRLPNSRCFNCGSYAHGIAACPRDHDQDRIAAAKAEQAASRPSAAFNALLNQRYFGGGGQYGELQPGVISEDLAEAVDMVSQSAPPPWLGRMVVLGLPPGWMQQANDDGEGGPLMKFVMGSENESDDDAEAAAAADAAAADRQQQTSDGTAAAAAADTDAGADGAAAGAAAEEAAAAGVAAENGKEQGEVAAVRATGQQQIPRYLFPGINAPPPKGADADAWAAELDKAESVARKLALGVTSWAW